MFIVSPETNDTSCQRLLVFQEAVKTYNPTFLLTHHAGLNCSKIFGIKTVKLEIYVTGKLFCWQIF